MSLVQVPQTAADISKFSTQYWNISLMMENLIEFSIFVFLSYNREGILKNVPSDSNVQIKVSRNKLLMT